ncbi:pre-rRNA-processing protein TSR1, partial [Tremellales sp. Uapishka_1]
MRESILLSEKLDGAGIRWDRHRRVMGIHLRGLWEGSQKGLIQLYVQGSFLSVNPAPHPLDPMPIPIQVDHGRFTALPKLTLQTGLMGLLPGLGHEFPPSPIYDEARDEDEDADEEGRITVDTKVLGKAKKTSLWMQRRRVGLRIKVDPGQTQLRPRIREIELPFLQRSRGQKLSIPVPFGWKRVSLGGWEMRSLGPPPSRGPLTVPKAVIASRAVEAGRAMYWDGTLHSVSLPLPNAVLVCIYHGIRSPVRVADAAIPEGERYREMEGRKAQGSLVAAPSALQEFLKKLDGLLAVPDFSLSPGGSETSDDTTNIVRSFASREEVLRCYYSEVHPFLPMLPPRQYLSDILPTLLPESPLLLGIQTILVLVPHPLDPAPKSANSARLRSAASFARGERTLQLVEEILEHSSSIECAQALMILSLWEWGNAGNVAKNRARAGQAVQVAMELGIHEMDRFGTTSRTLEGLDWPKDMARRTWWVIYVGQLTSALVSGNTPVVGPDDARVQVDFPICSLNDQSWSNWVNTVRRCSRAFDLINSLVYSQNQQVAAWGARPDLIPPEDKLALRRAVVEVDRAVSDLLREAEESSIIDLVPGGEEEVVRNQQLAARLGLAVTHIHIHRHQAFPEVSLFSKKICGLPKGPDIFATADVPLVKQAEALEGALPMPVQAPYFDPSTVIIAQTLPDDHPNQGLDTMLAPAPQFDFLDDLWEPETYPENLPQPWFATPNGAASLYYPVDVNPTPLPASIVSIGTNSPDGGAMNFGARRRGSVASSSTSNKTHKAWGVDGSPAQAPSPALGIDNEDNQLFPPGISLARCARAAHTIVRLEVLHRSASIAMWEGPPKWLPFCACGLVSGAYAFLLLALAVQAENSFGDYSQAKSDEVEALLTNVKVILGGLEAYGVMWAGIDVMAGKMAAPDSTGRPSKSLAASSKKARLNAQVQKRELKRKHVGEDMKFFSTSSGGGQVPRIISIIPLLPSLSPKTFAANLLASLGLSESEVAEISSRLSERGSYLVRAPRFKTSLQINLLPPLSLYATLDAALVSDYVVLLLSSTDEVQLEGEGVLRCLQGQVGGAEIVSCVQAPASNPITPATKQLIHKSLLSFTKYFFPSVEKIYSSDTPNESALLARALCEAAPGGTRNEDGRAYIVADGSEAVRWTPTETVEGVENGRLEVVGTIRGGNLSADRLVHIPGSGDYQVEAILAAPPSSLALANKPHQQATTMAVDSTTPLSVPTDAPDDLTATNTPDMMANEQTWPTEEEMGEGPSGSNGEKKRTKRVPKGTSAYQAAWIFDEEDEEDDEDEGENDLDMDGQVDEEKYVEENDEETEEIELDERRTEIHHDMDEDQEEKEYSSYLRERERAARDDMSFPDEIDTPRHIPARTRFQRYRGLKSFRTSPWDPYENLPIDYARIFQFENYEGTRKRIEREAREGGVSSGTRVVLVLKNVPKSLMEDRDPALPFIVHGLLQHEHKQSVLHFVVQRNTEYSEPVKAKEPLVLCVGPRRYVIRPLYSQHVRGGGKGVNNVHKSEKFLRPGAATVATTFGPICFGKTGCLLLKEEEEGKIPSLVAMGSFMSADPTRIISKRIILTGHPFKVHKKTATIRYMFFDRDDIDYFKTVEVHTKFGRIGHIKEPLGTHGYFKVHFDGPIQQMDTVCMSLYKRQYPKWAEEFRPSRIENLTEEEGADLEMDIE